MSSQIVFERPEQELLNFCDPVVGLFQYAVGMARYPGDPPIHVYGAATAAMGDSAALSSGKKRDGLGKTIVANGCALNKSEALWTLIGEAIERYSSLSYDSDAMIRARNTELGDHAIDLSKIITYSNGQYNSEGFPYYRPSENTEFAWVRGSELLSGKPALVPASLIYLNYQPSNPAEMILQAVTSGYGAGRTIWQAIFSGICEVIERDAFSCHWMLQKSGIELVPSSGTGAVAWTALYNFGTFDTKLYRLKMDHDIPVVTAVVYPHSTVGLSVGASCNPDIEVAAEKALIEAFHTWNWCGTIMRRELPTPCADDVSDFEEHVRYYLDADRSLAMQFLSDGRTEPLDTSVSRLKPAFQDEDYRTRALNLARTIEQIGYQSYVIEVTPRELRERGYFCAKVIIPGLQPLNAGHQLRNLDTRRLAELAKRTNTPFEVHHEPHPFP